MIEEYTRYPKQCQQVIVYFVDFVYTVYKPRIMKQAIVSGRISDKLSKELAKYCKKEDRTPSWFIGKSIEEKLARVNRRK